MARLSDLLPATRQKEVIEILGQSVECRALDIEEIGSLFLRFGRELGVAVAGNVAEAVRAAPEIIAAVMAAGMGNGGDAAEEAAAAALPVHAKVKLFGAILRLTMPEGIGPFVEDLAGLLGAAPQETPEPIPADLAGLARKALTKRSQPSSTH